MENKRNETQYRLNFLLSIIIIALPFLLGNIPYLNLLFLGVEQKVTYFWIAALIVFRPQLKIVVYFLMALFFVHYLLIIFFNNFGSATLGIILYISLIYLYLRLVKNQ